MITASGNAGTAFVAQWEDLRKRARSLETDVDVKLLNLNKLGASLGDVRGSTIHQEGSFGLDSVSLSRNTFEALSVDIQNLLDQLTNVNERMEELLRDSVYARNPASTHTMQRHREILQDYSHEFRRAQGNISGLLERELLMASSNAGVCKINMGSDGLNNRRSDLFLKEHEHIKSSDRLLDDQIGLALSTKESLFGQRLDLKNISKKMNTLTKRYPAVHSLMQKIHMRKRRDAMIIAAVVSLCLIIMFIYSIN
uniref:Golgi SNAP receptor complex member 1 n=1 Tax=Trichuris muris TaxID=70415 RepID=A0A5S6QHJ1_TRIMR